MVLVWCINLDCSKAYNLYDLVDPKVSVVSGGQVDEAALTGESLPVKVPRKDDEGKPASGRQMWPSRVLLPFGGGRVPF